MWSTGRRIRADSLVQLRRNQSQVPPHRSPTVRDSVRFMQSVMREFTEELYKYDELVEILGEFRMGSIGREDVIRSVKVLFDGHPDLLRGFNEFLPDGYKISIQDGESSAWG